MNLVGTCWELTRELDGHDRVMLVLRHDGPEALAVYLLHGDPARVPLPGREPAQARPVAEDSMTLRVMSPKATLAKRGPA